MITLTLIFMAFLIAAATIGAIILGVLTMVVGAVFCFPLILDITMIVLLVKAFRSKMKKKEIAV